jgi:hypothetical protein
LAFGSYLGSRAKSGSSGSSRNYVSNADDLSWADPASQSLLRENSKARHIVTRMRKFMAEECARVDHKGAAVVGEEGHRPLKVGLVLSSSLPGKEFSLL